MGRGVIEASREPPVTSPATTWEYKSIKLKLGGVLGGRVDQKELDRTLAEAGGEGWELVTVLVAALYQGRTKDAVAIFKRPGGTRAP